MVFGRKPTISPLDGQLDVAWDQARADGKEGGRLLLAECNIVSRSSAGQTSARSRRIASENWCREPTGLPLRFPL